LTLVLAAQPLFSATKELGGGFRDHGVATPVSNDRGIVATADGNGRDVALIWLYDHRGGYALLMADAETGKSEQFPTPYPWGGDGPYASLLSRDGKYYTHFGSHFSEFDPAKRAFTFWQRTKPMMAMSMTEADDGTIWSATYPSCGLASFNPKTREFKDHGYLNKENWAQYPRGVAVDDAGWVYIGLGSTAGQIIIYDPRSAKTKPFFAAGERIKGYPPVYREMDGKVYGKSPGAAPEDWLEFHKGEARKVNKRALKLKPIITGSQSLCHREFPSGRYLKGCGTVQRVLVVSDPKTRQTKTLNFDYTSEGAHIMGVAAAPDGTISGGTAFPMRFFSFNPKSDAWVNREGFGQFNTVARQGDRFFFGGYGHGFLLDWNPACEWKDTTKAGKDCNPLWLAEAYPAINRPHKLLAHPDGKTLVLAGTPAYGHTGGGLLFWDRETKARVLLEHTDILPEHSTMSLAPVPGGKLLGGTTTSAGTGGERKAKEAELYVMDLATKKVEWHAAVFPGAQGYTDLCAGPDGLVFGFADQKRFFVFDAANRKVIHEQDAGAKFGPTTSQQGPRVFVTDGKGGFYILFVKGIARLDPKTFEIKMLAQSPVPIAGGGDWLDRRIYFVNGSHVFSWTVVE
jgi:streptogramin lyase